MEQASAAPCLIEEASATPCLMEQALAAHCLMEQAFAMLMEEVPCLMEHASATPEQNRVHAEMNLARKLSLARRSSLPGSIYRSNFIEKPAITV